MHRVATLTLNPAIDGACEAEAVFPTHKIRTRAERYDPGGGGINVARVLARLGEVVEVVYLAGGATGALLDELLDQNGLERHRIAIHDHTRQSLAVFERSTGKEFRFVPEGPLVAEDEWRAAYDHCLTLDHGWLVASGSLPRGVPVDFYARLARAMPDRDMKLVVDTSGPALAAALEAGGLYLVKPSQGEFEALIGEKLDTPAAVGEAAMQWVRDGRAAHIAVTMGHEGAVLAHAGGVIIRPALQVPVKSATGAGDSFVAGMVHGFLRGEDAAGAFRWGMAAGTAAVLNPGTDLAHPDAMRYTWSALGDVR
ncbi:hexose kinase [Novosphingobium sp. FSY-8]|uniref:Phosphofructokinase n=1 Tax=Novosphingobium ovatum TaxID=1908523 RepID=A0ABW9XFZ6_9SPHN|nr:1-phosphofructokinase family hexose kinase [Novosphingobium ovatum]NBC37458.1 hexose kinase [Novosphingobium ovatum]